MSDRLGGVCYLSIDGVQLEVETDGFDIVDAGETKTAHMANGKLVGYDAEPRAAKVSCTVALPKGWPRKKILESNELTVSFELANGEFGTLVDAFCSAEVTQSGSSGNTTIEFTGREIIWS